MQPCLEILIEGKEDMIEFKINEKSYIIKNRKIEAICLFGSKARGDNDNLSDVDLFFLIEDCDEDTFVEIKKNLVVELKMPSHWISVYRISTFNTMYTYGSYFLWHLKTEGIVLFSRTGLLEKKLYTLPAYTKVEEDLNDYLVICTDIRKSISEDSVTLHLELSILASLIRNTCIAFTYLNGKYLFGRVEPVIVTKDLMGDTFPFDIYEYEELYGFRIAYTRGDVLSLPKPTVQYVIKWITHVEGLIKYVLKYKRGA